MLRVVVAVAVEEEEPPADTTLTDLFYPGDLGDVFIADAQYLFQDRAGTTPVITIGDPIRSIRGTVNNILAATFDDTYYYVYAEQDGVGYIDVGDGNMDLVGEFAESGFFIEQADLHPDDLWGYWDNDHGFFVAASGIFPAGTTAKQIGIAGSSDLYTDITFFYSRSGLNNRAGSGYVYSLDGPIDSGNLVFNEGYIPTGATLGVAEASRVVGSASRNSGSYNFYRDGGVDETIIEGAPASAADIFSREGGFDPTSVRLAILRQPSITAGTLARTVLLINKSIDTSLHQGIRDAM